MSIRKCFLLFILFFVCTTQAAHQQEVNIGVLAFRSKEHTQQQWRPTAEYLSSNIPEYHFRIQALGYSELENAAAKKTIDFVITNTGHYVILESLYGASRIATLMKQYSGVPITSFGSVIFTRSSRTDINSLKDLKAHSLIVVDKDSLGGYMAPFGELKKAGLEPKDFSSLAFTGMPHDLVVQAVLSGKADAGAVRTEVLEDMAREGAIKLEEIKVLGGRKNANFPFLHSTLLYPEWPIAKLDGASNPLANKVVVTLLGMPYANAAAKIGGYYGWTAPLDYQPVHELMKQLHIRPYDKTEEFDIQDVLHKYTLGLSATLFLALLAVGFGWRIWRLNFTLSKEITKRTEAEKQLREVTDTMAEGIYVLDKDGLITYTNPNASKILGFSKEEMAGESAHTLFHHTRLDGQNYPQAECDIAQVIASGMFYTSDNELFWRKDGKSVAVNASSSPIIRDGEIAGSVVAFQDIRDRKALEEQIRTSNQILYKVLNNIEADIVVIDMATYEVIFSNSHSIEVFGNIMGRKCFDGIEGLNSPCSFCPLSGCNLEEVSLDLKFVWEHKNEINGVWYSYRESVARWIDGKKVLVQIGFDITKLKELEGSLEAKVQEELAKREKQDRVLAQQSKMAAMGEMIGAIAHQWKQPLNGLAIVVQDTKEAFRFGELDEEYLNKSVAESMELIRHMSKTIDDFRNFFRPDKEKESFVVSSIVGGVLSILAAGLREYNIAVGVVEDEPNVEAFGYPNEFKQVILNIVNNAKDALLEKKVANPLITVTICKKDGGVTIYIKDNAGGIPDEVMEHIFEPFFTTKSNEKGTGIGLSMSKSIIEDSMQGSLTVANVGDGAEFTIVV